MTDTVEELIYLLLYIYVYMITITNSMYSLLKVYNYKDNTGKDLHLLHNELHLLNEYSVYARK